MTGEKGINVSNGEDWGSLYNYVCRAMSERGDI